MVYISGVKIAPSILSADFSRLGQQVQEAVSGGADWLHIDIMDGVFVPNLSFGPVVIKAVRNITDIPFDVHLMIEHPDRYVDEYVKAGADYLVVHAETRIHLHRTLQHIRDHGAKAGMALNPGTPLEYVKHLLEDLDLVVIMTVNPGFGGQGFIKTMIPKIREVSQIIKDSGLSIELEVDGGVDPTTAPMVVEAGATALVAGSAVFRGKGSIAENIQGIRASFE